MTSLFCSTMLIIIITGKFEKMERIVCNERKDLDVEPQCVFIVSLRKCINSLSKLIILRQSYHFSIHLSRVHFYYQYISDKNPNELLYIIRFILQLFIQRKKPRNLINEGAGTFPPGIQIANKKIK